MCDLHIYTAVYAVHIPNIRRSYEGVFRVFFAFQMSPVVAIITSQQITLHNLIFCFIKAKGGGPRVVISTAAFHAKVRGSVPGIGGLKETKMFLPHPHVKVSIVGSLRDREVACSASDRQGSNFESCVWRTVSSQSSHHPQEVLLAQFSLFVHKGGLKPDSFHFIKAKYCCTRWIMSRIHICMAMGIVHVILLDGKLWQPMGYDFSILK